MSAKNQDRAPRRGPAPKQSSFAGRQRLAAVIASTTGCESAGKQTTNSRVRTTKHHRQLEQQALRHHRQPALEPGLAVQPRAAAVSTGAELQPQPLSQLLAQPQPLLRWNSPPNRPWPPLLPQLLSQPQVGAGAQSVQLLSQLVAQPPLLPQLPPCRRLNNPPPWLPPLPPPKRWPPLLPQLPPPNRRA